MPKIMKYVFIILNLRAGVEKSFSEKSKTCQANMKLTKIRLEETGTTFINNFYQRMLLI